MDSGSPRLPFGLQRVCREEFDLKGLRVRGLKPEFVRQFPVEAQNAVVEAVTTGLSITCLLAVVKPQLRCPGLCRRANRVAGRTLAKSAHCLSCQYTKLPPIL